MRSVCVCVCVSVCLCVCVCVHTDVKHRLLGLCVFNLQSLMVYCTINIESYSSSTRLGTCGVRILG